MVSHGNMTAQSRCITEAGGYDGQSVTLSWMPHFHDYGLVKGIIQPAWIGRPAYLMSPLTFLKRPLRWLEAIHRYRVTHSGGPNFAYRHCIEAIPVEDRAKVDLSGWEVASCGAEPIASDTIDRFAEAFAPAGFRREAFSPAYGMAEFTLLISLKRQGLLPTVQALDPAALEQGVVSRAKPEAEPVRQVVGCGVPVGDTKVIIAHPETLSHCAAQQIGEIWLAGASTAQGYWNNPEETARTFGAMLRDTGEGPFLRTGDLGFVKDGEVFVTGRLKDLLIVRGRNHYPQDIERTVEQCHALFRVGGAAAFSVQEAGEEVVVVVQEVERQSAALAIDELAAAIRAAVSEHHDLHVSLHRVHQGGQRFQRLPAERYNDGPVENNFQGRALDHRSRVSFNRRSISFPQRDASRGQNLSDCSHPMHDDGRSSSICASMIADRVGCCRMPYTAADRYISWDWIR